MKTKNQITNSIKRYEIISHWINNCDSKSSFLLGFYGVILTVIASSKLIDNMKIIFLLKPCVNCIDINSVINFILLITLIAFIFFTIKCFYFIYYTLKARINPDLYSQNQLNTNSSVFFLTISKNRFEDFENRINNENKLAFLNDINSQVYINSCIATQKFINYNKSLNATFFGLISLIVFIVLNQYNY